LLHDWLGVDMVENGEQTNAANQQGAGNNPVPESVKDNSVLGKTTAMVERAEKANKEFSELLDRRDKIAAENMLAGTAGGHVEPEKEKPISDVEYANKFMSGEANPLEEDDISIN